MTTHLHESMYELYWQGPYTIKQLKKIQKKSPEQSDTWSLYAKYENHPLYGRNVLTYIGKAEKQSVVKRLSQHDLDQEIIYVATIYKFESWKKSYTNFEEDWGKQGHMIRKKGGHGAIISHIEELLIYALWPAGNLRNKNTAKNSWEYRLFNTGYIGSLPAEISGHYALENAPEPDNE